MSETPTQWSVRTWKQRHDAGYFPNSEEHRGWKVCPRVPEWLAERVRGSDRVLEVGCGYAEWMIPLSPLVLSVTGVDIHASPVRKGRELAAERGIDNISLLVSNGTALPFPDSQFSVVYSISVFQHLPRTIVEGYLRETARVLVGGGTALHHFRNADNVGPYPPLATDIGVDHRGDFSVGWTADEVWAGFEGAGLAEVEVLDLGLFLVGTGRKGGLR